MPIFFSLVCDYRCWFRLLPQEVRVKHTATSWLHSSIRDCSRNQLWNWAWLGLEQCVAMPTGIGSQSIVELEMVGIGSVAFIRFCWVNHKQLSQMKLSFKKRKDLVTVSLFFRSSGTPSLHSLVKLSFFIAISRHYSIAHSSRSKHLSNACWKLSPVA